MPTPWHWLASLRTEHQLGILIMPIGLDLRKRGSILPSHLQFIPLFGKESLCSMELLALLLTRFKRMHEWFGRS